MATEDLQPIHLNDEQFAACLDAEPTTDLAAHLDGCEACREELRQFQMAMDDFGTAAMAWSEAQPRVSLRAQAEVGWRPSWVMGAGWAVATALVLAVAGPAIWRHESGQAAPLEQVEPAVVAVQQADSEAEIAQDNRLLQSVNLAINDADPSPLQEYRLDGPRSGSKARMALRDE